MSECPICKIEFNQTGNTAICETCDAKRFFNDDSREIRYRKGTVIRIAKLKSVFGDDYDEVLHNDMVRQIVRCEINMNYYEKQIANDDENKETMELLRSERSHWRSLADKLNLTIKSIRKDTKFMKHEVTGTFKDYLSKILEDMADKDKPKESSDNLEVK